MTASVDPDDGVAASTPEHVQIVVMGVSGSGKSTVGSILASELRARFVDGDALHPPANVAKMAAGVPLDDEDRWPWLAEVARVLAEPARTAIVVACSALRRAYRDAIRRGAPNAIFIELDGSRALLEERLSDRHGHFMPSSLLDSQLETLEPLQPDERGARIGIGPSPDDVAMAAAAEVRRLR